MLEGEWPVPLGIPLHLELHRQRPDVVVAVHSHPRYATIWADLGRSRRCYDQSSALGGGELVVVDEYDGPVNARDSAARAVASMGGGRHGPPGQSRRLRDRPGASAPSTSAPSPSSTGRRGRWHVEALAPGRELPEPARSFFRASDGEGFIGFFEAMARQELRLDPDLLEP